MLRRSILLFILAFPIMAIAGKPIENLVDIPVPVNVDGSQPSIDDVRTAVIAGCRTRGWTPVLGDGNTVIASILVRSTHYAEVEISYTDLAYSITYKSSRELDYDQKKQEIHRNYNKWISNLSESIQAEFGVRS
jgi:hypothetical protein